MFKKRKNYKELYFEEKERNDRILLQLKELYKEFNETTKNQEDYFIEDFFTTMECNKDEEIEDFFNIFLNDIKKNDIQLNILFSLNKDFNELTKLILGEDYYNEGLDHYSCNKFTCRDIIDEFNKINKFLLFKKKIENPFRNRGNNDE